MNKIIFFLLSLLFAGSVTAQSSEDEMSKNLRALPAYNEGLNLINSQILQVNTQQLLNSAGNNINISQIGNGNLSDIVSFSENSTIALQQIGNGNTSVLEVRALSIDYELSQRGADNYMAEYSNAPNIELYRGFSQTGDRNNLIIHGANTLTKDLKLNIQGNAKTVIIRNFN